MATGTGKTYTAFQIIWRLRQAGIAKRTLFLADRNVLVDQTMTNDFKPFGGWTSPFMKQYVGNKSFHDVGYDGDWAPESSLRSRPRC